MSRSIAIDPNKTTIAQACAHVATTTGSAVMLIGPDTACIIIVTGDQAEDMYKAFAKSDTVAVSSHANTTTYLGKAGIPQ